MNARQAAKKWKRKYEELAEKPMPKVYVEPKQTETFTVARSFDPRETASQGYVEMVMDDMAKQLGRDIVAKCGRVETQNDIKHMTMNMRIVVKAVVL